LDDSVKPDDLDAGDFSTWLIRMADAIVGKETMEVPCNGCTACCTSSQFIHIAPKEKSTLNKVPGELLFPAPRMPRGYVLLGFNEEGHCPMQVGGHCLIYENRPKTCRAYDCRIFPATGLVIEERYPRIAAQAGRWRFQMESDADRILHEACKLAARFLKVHSDKLPEKVRPTTRTQLAVLAIRVYQVFLGGDEETGLLIVKPNLNTVLEEVKRQFEPRTS
jgi:Fe-S-cluster containining protein